MAKKQKVGKQIGEIKIERGVPVPPGRNGGPRYPWRDMEPGDSFWMAGDKNLQENLSSCAAGFTRRHGGKFITRQMDGGVRVFRVE